MSDQQPNPFQPRPDQPWATPDPAAPAPAAPPPAYPPAAPAPAAPPPAYPPAAGGPAYPPPAYPPAQPGYPGYGQPEGYPPGGYASPAAYPPAQPPAQPYGYGAAPQGGYGQWAAPQHNLAQWGDRVLATLIDALYQLPAALLVFLGLMLAAANSGRGGNGALAGIGGILAGLGYLGAFAVSIYNIIVVQGRTGQSWGKKRRGLKIVQQDTGQILSLGNNFLRNLCHVVDGAVFYIGYLFPLWDPMRQTLADKIMRTVVVKV